MGEIPKMYFFFWEGGESLGSQWTSIVLQEWESDQSWMVMDMG